MSNRSERRKSRLPGIKKRNFLSKGKAAVIGAAALGITAAAIAFTSSDSLHPNYQVPAISVNVQKQNLQLVRSGTYDAASYIDNLVAESTYIQDLIGKGIIAGVLYNQTPEELSEKVRQLHEGKVPESVLEVQLNRYNTDGIRELIRTTPTVTADAFYGLAVPHFLHIPEYFLLQSTNLETDDDVRAVLEHEAKHAEDMQGISYGNFEITREDMLEKKVTPFFLRGLFEVRAHYSELKNAFAANNKIIIGDYSDAYVQNVAKNYYYYWASIQSMQLTEEEKQAWELQKQEMPGIIPVKVSGYQIRIQFSLFGLEAPWNLTFDSPIFR